MNILSRVCSLVVFHAVFLVNCSSIVLLLVMHCFYFYVLFVYFLLFTFNDVFCVFL